jgi:hypothetical protein
MQLTAAAVTPPAEHAARRPAGAADVAAADADVIGAGGRLMKIPFFSSYLLVILVLLCGAPMFGTGVAAQVVSGSDDAWNPCDENMMGGPGDWAVFHVWCFKTDASTTVDTFAKEDILRMETQCPDTHFKNERTIRRDGPDAILFKTEPNSKFGPIFVAYYKSKCGIVKQLCRAGSEGMARSAYSNFLSNVRGEYGECLILDNSK